MVKKVKVFSMGHVRGNRTRSWCQEHRSFMIVADFLSITAFSVFNPLVTFINYPL